MNYLIRKIAIGMGVITKALKDMCRISINDFLFSPGSKFLLEFGENYLIFVQHSEIKKCCLNAIHCCCLLCEGFLLVEN